MPGRLASWGIQHPSIGKPAHSQAVSNLSIELLLIGSFTIVGDDLVRWLMDSVNRATVDFKMVSTEAWITAVMSLSALLSAVSLGLLVAGALTPDAPR